MNPFSPVDIAAEAQFQLSVAKEKLDWVLALASAIELDLEHGLGKRSAALAGLASYLGDTGFASMDDDIDAFRKIAELEAAPQNTNLENVARIPLVEFSKGRQSEAGVDLGVSQAAINKALQIGREIYVMANGDGSFSAFEVKPFPSRSNSEGAE